MTSSTFFLFWHATAIPVIIGNIGHSWHANNECGICPGLTPVIADTPSTSASKSVGVQMVLFKPSRMPEIHQPPTELLYLFCSTSFRYSSIIRMVCTMLHFFVCQLASIQCSFLLGSNKCEFVIYLTALPTLVHLAVSWLHLPPVHACCPHLHFIKHYNL